MNRKELKANAKLQIKGNIGILFVITLIVAVLSALANWILGFIPYVGSLVATIIITPAFALSVIRVYLSLPVRKPEVKDAFSGFDDFWSAFKVSFLTGLYTFLWSLLFVIPGIVKYYSYSMAMMILAENKGKSARECINESKQLTNGHKGELFVLDLSFIGWILLGSVTFGIAFIWVTPYMIATTTNAY
ncbi:MAG: DUF975 family protein, partial [Oscillospiraceae bacterium]|nr:DUF975 family protein [Oscillospiraceae bacterium]